MKLEKIMDDLQIPAEWHAGLEAMRNAKGCELEFSSHGHMQQARAMVAEANLSYGEVNGIKLVVFLDAAKTRSELRPSFLTHRAYDVIGDVEVSKQPPGILEKDMRGKTIKLKLGDNAATRLVYSLAGVWQWTAYAARPYEDDELDMMSAYINGH